MPWKRIDVSEQRVRFVVRAASGQETLSGLCREFGISRPSGYRWLQRYRRVDSVTGLCERSRRPLRSLGQTRGEIARRGGGWSGRMMRMRRR